jgi:MipA family protein
MQKAAKSGSVLAVAGAAGAAPAGVLGLAMEGGLWHSAVTMYNATGRRRRGSGWAAGLACWLVAGASPGGTLGVRVENPPSAGTVVVWLFDEADTFADLRDPVRTLTVLPEQRGAAVFGGLAPGRYAVMVFHDANANGALDQNFMGIPREPLGFSRRYWGRGSPVFSEASVEVAAGETVAVPVELKQIFGRRGLIGVGAGAIVQSSPYRGAESARVQAIPAITYIGERIQVLGPFAQVGLVHWPRVRLAATARYRLGAYDEEDSDYLEGMGDRKDSLFAGLALQAPLAWGVRMSAGYEHDVLDRVGGGFGRLALRRGWQAGRFSVAPNAAVNWLTPELARHEYGVRAAEAREGRAEYRPDGAVNLELGLGLAVEWREAWRVMLNASVEFLAKELRDSSLVDESTVFHGFFAVNYTF